MSRKSVRLKPSLPRLRLREPVKDVAASDERPQSEQSQRSRSKSPPQLQPLCSQGQSASPLEGTKAPSSGKEHTFLEIGAKGAEAGSLDASGRSGTGNASSVVVARGGGMSASQRPKPTTSPQPPPPRLGAVQGAAAKRSAKPKGRPVPKALSFIPSSPASVAETAGQTTPAESAASTTTSPRTPSAGQMMPKVSTAGIAPALRAPTVVQAPTAGSTKTAALVPKATSSQSMASTVATQSCSPTPSNGRDSASDLYHAQADLLELLDNEFSGTEVSVDDMISSETKELYQCFLKGYARASCARKRQLPIRDDLWELFQEVCAGEPLASGEDDEKDPSDGYDHYAYFARYAPPIEPAECPEDNERRLHSMQMKFLGTRMALRSLRQQAYQEALQRKKGQRKDGTVYFDWSQVTSAEAAAGSSSPRHRHSISYEMSPLDSEPTLVQTPTAEKSPTLLRRAGSTRLSMKANSDEEAAFDNRRGTAFFWRQLSDDSDDSQKSQKREHRQSCIGPTSGDSNSKRLTCLGPNAICDESNSKHSMTIGASSPPTDNEESRGSDSEMWAEPRVQVPLSPRRSALSQPGDSKRGKGIHIGFQVDDEEKDRRTPDIQPLEGSETPTSGSAKLQEDSPKSALTSAMSTPSAQRIRPPVLSRRAARRGSKLDERRKSRKNQVLSSTSAAVTQAMKAEMRTREACESLRFLVFGCHAEEKRAKTSAGAFYDQACGNRDEVLQLHRIWTQMDEDGSGDIEFHEFLNFFSKSKADRLLGMRCVKYLVGTGMCDNTGDEPPGCRIEDMMRLIWLKATKDDIATMMHWFHEAEYNKDRAPTPPLLPKRKRREILENFPILEQGGMITFQDLVDSGLVDESTARDLREEHDQDNTNRIGKDMLLLMLCPNGFRVKVTDMTAVDKEGRKIMYISNEYFTGWLITGKTHILDDEPVEPDH